MWSQLESATDHGDGDDDDDDDDDYDHDDGDDGDPGDNDDDGDGWQLAIPEIPVIWWRRGEREKGEMAVVHVLSACDIKPGSRSLLQVAAGL